jgi:hypothetical protein
LRKSLSTRLLIGLAAAAALTSIATLPASAADSASNTSASHEATVTFQWLSHQGYIKKFGRDPKSLPTTPLPTKVKIRTVAPGVHPNAVDYTIRFAGTDDDGFYLPTRNGISYDEQGDEWGYLHYAGPHNLTSQTPVLAAYNDNLPDAVSGDRREYTAYLTDSSGDLYATILAINWQGTSTQDGKFTTPDGRPIGTITAYCQGVTLCPAAVNQ